MPPALRALVIELVATLVGVAAGVQLQAPGWATALAIGGCGAAGAALARMDRWWPALLAALPVAVWAASRLSLAPGWWGLGALALLAMYGGVYRTQVPLFLSRRPVWDAVLTLLPAPRAGRPLRLVDLGSGLGGLPSFVGRARPDVHCEGVELAVLPAMLARLRQWIRPLPNVQLRRADLWHVPLADVDLAFAFLSPVPMAALWDHVAAHMPPGACLVSCEFPVPGRVIDGRIEAAGRTLYVYRIPDPSRP